ncbi:hypothetical protein IKG20_01535 [Candidatus Saccharibacteria bacterium]|nr:hypothetical protein [Candidatus Saccharibacteria bacterium]
MNLSSLLASIALLFYTLIVFAFYTKVKSKKGMIITSLLLGIAMAIIAYNYIPNSTYDLVRHHQLATRFTNVESFDGFIKTLASNYEFIPQLFMLLVAKIGDLNLLQTIFVLVGYSSLFYILIDYKNRANLTPGKFICVFLLITFGQHINYYYSGLFNYAAINLFALAVYLDYVKGHKVLPLIIYAISPFIHKSMFLPLLIVCIFKLKRGKTSKRFWCLYIIFLLLFTVLADFIVGLLNISYLTQAKNALNSYIANSGTEQMLGWYGGVYLLMSVLKVFIVAWACFIERKNANNTTVRNITNLTNLSVVVLSLSAIALTRFTSLTLFISTPIIIDAMKKDTPSSKWFHIAVLIVGVLFLAISIGVMIPRFNFT